MMRYAEFRNHVRILWQEARYRYTIEPWFRRWITERTLDRVFDAAIHTDDAPDHLRDHIAFDLRLAGQELERFLFWWNHAMEKGFNADNPLAHLHKKGAKA
jgi:hypothetical protein